MLQHYATLAILEHLLHVPLHVTALTYCYPFVGLIVLLKVSAKWLSVNVDSLKSLKNIV